MDELNNLIFLKEMKPSQQLFSRLTEKIPETKSLAVGLLKKSTEMTFEICEDDLVLAPTEFDFKADSNAIAYLKSLVKSAAILELLPQMLSILAQRIVSELYQMTEKCLAKAMKEYHRAFSFEKYRIVLGLDEDWMYLTGPCYLPSSEAAWKSRRGGSWTPLSPCCGDSAKTCLDTFSRQQTPFK